MRYHYLKDELKKVGIIGFGLLRVFNLHIEG